jgi:uncharacterized protein YgiM (DUF1202 family)
MKKAVKRVICLALILVCLLAYVPQAQAAQPPARPDELYLTQNVAGTCTLCSSAMMIRTSMYLHGNNNWSKVTENALRPYAWLSGVGLLWSFSYTVGNTTVKVGHKSINGITDQELKRLLDEHPEGIVLYCGKLPHALLVTGYDGDVFYCADTVQGISETQVTLKKSWLGIMYGSQAAVLKKATAYWYMTDYIENGQSIGYCDCTRTNAGTYQVTGSVEFLRIRAGHSTNDAVLGEIPRGAKVTVTKASGQGKRDWAHVSYNGITGYASMEYLKKVPCNHEYGEWGNSEVKDQEIRTCKLCGATESRQREPGKLGTVNTDGLNVRSAPGTGNPLVEQLWKGDRVEVYETKQADGLEWGRIDTGWVCMKYVDLDKAGTMGTVTGSSVNIREGAGTDYLAMGTKNAGDRVEVFETKEAGGRMWGRIREGWICMDYVELDEQETPIATGTVISANGKIDWLNVRADAGSGYSQVGRLEIGEKVELLEIKQVGTQQWGRIAEGWVLMDYVKLDTTETPIATGTVTGLLNIRSAAGTQNTQVGQLQAGTALEFFEFKQVGTKQWGRIAQGWVLMDYVRLDVEEEVIATGTVTGLLNIRSAAGTQYSKVGQLQVNTRLEFFEFKQVGTQQWGRIAQGWVLMDYVKLDVEEEVIATGTVTGLLNIRSAAGTQYSKVGQLQAGTSLEFFEFKQVGTQQWGRIAQGWVLMDYVKLDGAEEPETIIGTVTGNSVRIRISAVTGSVIGYYYAGDRVEILETTVVDGVTWGRTDKGWVCMDYVDCET